jgi:hypothetical protein
MVVKDRILKSVGRRRLIIYRESSPLQKLVHNNVFYQTQFTPTFKSVRVRLATQTAHTMLCLPVVSHLTIGRMDSQPTR